MVEQIKRAQLAVVSIQDFGFCCLLFLAAVTFSEFLTLRSTLIIYLLLQLCFLITLWCCLSMTELTLALHFAPIF